jgi:hypothetical protein
MNPEQFIGLFVSISDQTCDPCRRSEAVIRVASTPIPPHRPFEAAQPSIFIILRYCFSRK